MTGVLEQESLRSDVVSAARAFVASYKRFYNAPFAQATKQAYARDRDALIKAVAEHELAIGEYEWAVEEA